MRTWVGSFLLALAVTACGGMTSDPPTQGPCEDGETKPSEDGCNTCTCTDGAWLCTQSPCPEPACEPGDGSNDGCNTCTCTAEGIWACTDLICEPLCMDGNVMTESCNTCTCVDGNWACDESACIAFCQAGSVKAAGDGCNTCSCEDGAWLCTEKACAEPECPIPDDLPDQTCPGVELYGRAEGTDACCELCYSLEGYRYYDSMEACEASKVCTQGDTKYADDECNTCTCTVDEVWACTAEDCEAVFCGGLGGSSCSESEYCAYEANMGGCGVGDANAICRPRPTGCDDVYEPVCGCNGETYSTASPRWPAGA
jgi:hypothetical protein